MNLLLLGAAALSGVVAAANGGPAPWTDMPLPGGARGLAAAAGIDPGHPAWAVPADIAVRFHSPQDPAAHALDRRRLLGYLAAMPMQTSTTDRAPLPLTEERWRASLLPPESSTRPLVAAILLDAAAARMYRALLSVDAGTLAFLASREDALSRLRPHASVLALFAEGLRVENGVAVTPGGPAAVAAWEALAGVGVGQPLDFVEKLASLGDGRPLALHHVLATMPEAEVSRLLRTDAGAAAATAALTDLAAAFDAQPAWWLARTTTTRPPVIADEIVRLVAQAGGAAAQVRSIATAPGEEGRARLAAVAFGARVLASAPGSDDVARAITGRPALALALERAGVTATDLFSGFTAVAAAAEKRNDPVVVESLQAAIAALITRSRRTGDPLSREDVAALSAAVAGRDPVRALAQVATSDSAGTRPASAERAAELTFEGVRYSLDPLGAADRSAQRWREALEIDLEAALAATPGDAATRRLARDLRGLVYVADAPDSDTLLRSAGGLVERHEVPLGDPWRLPSYVAEGAGGRVVGSLLGLDVALSRFDLRRAGTLPSAPRLGPPARQAIAETVALVNALPGDTLPATVRAAVDAGRQRVASLRGPGPEMDGVLREGLHGWRKGAFQWLVLRAPERAVDAMTLHELAWLGGLRAEGVRGWGSARGPVGPQGHPWFGPPPRWDLMDGGHPVVARLADPALVALVIVAERGLPGALAAPLLAHLVQWVIDEARPAHDFDGPGMARALRRFGLAEQEDAIAALAGGVLVPQGVATENPGGDRP